MKANLKRAVAAFTAAISLIAGTIASADYRTTNGTSNDNGDGTYLNPVMNTDVADPDVICAPSPDGSEAYYMVSTAMQYAPGCPIMKSTDLVNWETVTNLFGSLDYGNDALALRNGRQAYGQGQWATSIRYSETNKMFYILTFSYSTNTTQVYTSHDIENGPWKKSEFKCFHDPSIFIDTDGRIYVFYGQNSINCKELIENDGYLTVKPEAGDPDNSGVTVIPDMGVFDVPDCIYKDAQPPKDFIIRGEGTHAYKIDGRYYLISITWPSGPVWENGNEYWKRGEVCYRSVPDENGEHHVYGPYEGMLIMNQTADYDGYVGGGGVGQGGMTNAIGGSNRSSGGKWYGLIFQDRGAVGRCPHLATVDWNTPGYEGWPMMTAAEKGVIPTESGAASEKKSLVISDEFDNRDKLNYAPVITPEPEAAAMDAGGETFRLRYGYNDEADMPAKIEIASAEAEPDGWTQIKGTFTTASSITYGHLEIAADNPLLNFYVDDVSVTDADGAEYAHNGEMGGNAGEPPWWWGTTTVWRNNQNEPTAEAAADTAEYHDSAPSMYIHSREDAESGAMQYINDGDGIKPETEYTVSAWVKYKSGGASTPAPAATPVPTEDGEELIINGGFETGEIAPWTPRYGNGTTLTISDSAAASGKYSAYADGRTQTGDGPKYDLTGYIENRREYVISAKVRYDGGPAERTFNLTLEHVNDAGEMGWTVLGSVTAKRGEWSVISAKYQVDQNIGTASSNIYFETPYNVSPTAEELAGFYIDDVSVIRLPAKEWEEATAEETEPNGSNLAPEWQWNHNPDNRYWSLTERGGYLRLTAGKVVKNIQQARNTLTQRTFGPECSGWTALETAGMKDGDYAGLAAFAARYGFIGVTRRDGKNHIVYVTTDSTPADRDVMMETVPREKEIAELTADRVYLKTEYTFAGNRSGDTVEFYYSLDGESWTLAGRMSDLEYSMLHFTGYKFALFNFATAERGGYADFDYFRVDDTRTGEGGAASVKITSAERTESGAAVKAAVTDPASRELTVYAAAYGAGGELTAVVSQKVSGAAEPELELKAADTSGGIKVFLWDGMKPASEAAEYK